MKNNAWILVAGTGLSSGLPSAVCLAAEAVGRAIGNFGCGLVTGGWPGVDYIAAEAFASSMSRQQEKLEHRFVQVVSSDRQADFQGGRIVRTSPGALEWLQPQSYCDAVVLIGGLGGTYGAFLSALSRGLPRFPLGGTGGDAARAFSNMCELWDALPNQGVPKSAFEQLGRSITTPSEADALAALLLPMVIDALDYRQGRAKQSIFLSYSRRDAFWRDRILAALAPVQHSGSAHLWSDADIEAGAQWDTEIRRKLDICDIAVLLVSDAFLDSTYVQQVELPILTARARAGRTHLLWVPLGSTTKRPDDLACIQSVVDPARPLQTLDDAELQVAMVAISQGVQKHLPSA